MDITIICGDSQRAAVEETVGNGCKVVSPSAFAPGALAIIWLDGLDDAGFATLSVSLVDAEPRPIAVRGARWDGFEPIPLAAHCRGIIAGFGLAGLRAAIAMLDSAPGQE